MLNSTMKDRFNAAETFKKYMTRVKENAELWKAIYDHAKVDSDQVERALAIPGEWHLLVLAEEWCGDAVNILPVVARLVESIPTLDMRILSRDENPDLMDEHRTDTSRSIPVIMILDDQYEEVAWWGPRPSELQRLAEEDWKGLDKDERYKRIRGWFARDKGRTTIAEITRVMERATARVMA